MERTSRTRKTYAQPYYACPFSVVNNHTFAYLHKYINNLFVKNTFLIIFLTCNSQEQMIMGVDTLYGRMLLKKST
jgi:hypothetical protein